jgi:molybdenum ABC transporter molybdate-binding protein
MLIRVVLLVLAAIMTVPAIAAEPVLLYSAGSLRSALNEAAAAFEAAHGQRVQAKYGASGLLKDEIAGGAPASVFASANMEHPQALANAKKSGPVVLFARNRLCALVRPGLAVESATLLDRMLHAGVKLGTSTPRADPSGDYAWEVFRKADKLRPGAFATLETKALQLTGGARRRLAAGLPVRHVHAVGRRAADSRQTWLHGAGIAAMKKMIGVVWLTRFLRRTGSPLRRKTLWGFRPCRYKTRLSG